MRKILHLKRVLLFFGLSLLLLAGPGYSKALQQPIIRYAHNYHPVVGAHGMVVSQKRLASEVGASILSQGGNAVDAAVAVGFALAVVLPRAGNLGGGGFMLVHLADTEKTIALDFRERAPAAAHADMFLDDTGAVDGQRYRYSHLAVGVPGTVAGLTHALDRYGTMPLAVVLKPAVQLAASGYVLDYDIAAAIASRATTLKANPASAATFFQADGRAFQAGDLFQQAALARTLQLIADQGSSAFYSGHIAQQIVADMVANQGLIKRQDLADYKVTEREVVSGTYKGYEIRSMPPPSSGGVHLIQMLNTIKNFPLTDYGPYSAAGYHVLAEAMKYAYADRSEHLGDPDYYDVPLDWLTSEAYGAELAAKIQEKRAIPSDEIRPGTPEPYESEDTTHYSVMDESGNAVAVTYTLNFSFGSGITVPGAGFLLNNEMADFSAKPGTPNPFGMLGGVANAVEPGKRPLSAMTPTIVTKNGKAVLVTGSPGGSRIITTVLQHLVNVLVHGQNVAVANNTPRIHHQWYPDVLYHEAGMSPDTLQLLETWGHQLQERTTMGSVQAIYSDGQYFYGSADPRRPGAAAIPASASEAP